MALYAKVILGMSNSQIDKIFDYEIPFEMFSEIEPGMRVKVPFGNGNRTKEAYVVDICDKTQVNDEKIKFIQSVTDRQSFLSPEMLFLAGWMKKRYIATFSSCLRTLVPAGADLKNTVKSVFLKDEAAAEEYVEKYKDNLRYKGQCEVLKFLIENKSSEEKTIKDELKITSSPIKTLADKGFIYFESTRRMLKTKSVPKYEKHILNEEQQRAFEGLSKGKNDKPYLLFGITGSGKTEVYLQYIEKLIEDGKQAIVLVPEISLTSLMAERFKGRFGTDAAVVHSRMSEGERLDVWFKAKNGEVSVVIGPRSAVFMPFEKLGAIIIDEEHDSSYKSEITPKYDAAEVAWIRCVKNNAKLVMGSATPSIRTYFAAEKGNINVLRLENRAGKGALPKTEIVDMRIELENGNKSVVSRRLYEEIKDKLENKKQIILFINRRGASTFVSCRKCGYVMKCTRCNVSYKYHSAGNFLMCHYCGKKVSVPKVCPSCGSKYIKYFGVGTQKIEDEIKKLFPHARVLRMDFDTTAGKNGHSKILQSFKEKQADILIGTQMIAKGHDFPNVALVGIMAADLSLNMSDFSASEITFQLITQAAGRAGRADDGGKVIIQTYQSENFAIQSAARQNYEEFYTQEIQWRKLMEYPPFSYVYTVLATGKDVNKTSEAVFVLADMLKAENKERFIILGPSEAIISKIKDEYRFRIIIKGNNDEQMRRYVEKCLEKFGGRNGYRDVYMNLFMNSQSVL